jgi:hypothetical protein
MKHIDLLKIVILITAFLGITNITDAQIIISGEMLEKASFAIDLQVRDSVTNQPIGFASAYLQHPMDTIITNFALSDDKGKASIKKVTKGQYILTIEFMGYLPYHKTFYARGEKDLGILKMVPDVQALKAARISAAANPIEIRKDTIIYNAAAFKVSQNANLLELLKKMPGVEVDDKGNVKVNGTEVSKITIGGKTFFTGDNSAALNNLPAKVVSKVKVVDKDSDAAAFSGIADEKKQRVMDVELKDEYKKGWFGNLKLGAGSTAYGDKDEFKDQRGLLYSGTGMLSTYNEKDQLTVLGSSLNAQMRNDAMVIMVDRDNDESDMGEGLPKASLFGANLNTSRWKGMESTIYGNFKSNRIDDFRRTDRTTFQENYDDIHGITDELMYAKRNSYKLRGDFEKIDKKKWTFTFYPSFYISDTDRNSDKTSTTLFGNVQKNSAKTTTGSSTKYYRANGDFTLGIKDLGKKRRSLVFTGEYVFGGSDGNSFERSSTYYNAIDSTMERNLLYDKTYSNYSLGGSIQYVEPIGKLWAVQTYLSSYYKVRKSDNAASNADGSSNEYYTSNADNYYFTNYGRLLMQYKKDATSLQFGGSARAISNENYAHSFGIDTRTGVNELLWNWSPFIRLNTSIKKQNFNFSYSGDAERPLQSEIAPAIDIVNPTRISIGNIYLRPSFTHSIGVSLSGGNDEKHRSYYLSCYSNINMKETVTASWFDSNSVQYSIPVNAKNNGYTLNINSSFDTPLNAKRNLRFSVYAYSYLTFKTNYQSSGILDGLNTDKFIYSDFISKFWGNSKGDIFYSGASGFKKSNTTTLSLYLDPSVTYKGDFLTIEGGSSIHKQTAKYSIDSKANVSTWELYYFITPTWTTAKDLDISASIGYDTYYGYPKGYNEPRWMCAASISKSIRGITLSLMADDLLNQNRYRSKTNGYNYTEDYNRLCIGRKIMMSITFNFGKANAMKNQAARQSLWNLM